MSDLERTSTIICGSGGRSATSSLSAAGCCTGSLPISTARRRVRHDRGGARVGACAEGECAEQSCRRPDDRAVRGFARYMAGIDPETEVPPAGLVRRPRSRGARPFIYTDGGLLALIEQARAAIPQPLRAATIADADRAARRKRPAGR